MTPRVVPDGPISEAVWQRHVLAIAKEHGWRANHTYTGKVGKGAWRTNTTMKGFPDLTLLRPGELLFVELKADRGVLSGEQEEVLRWLEDAGAECHVWRPRDWHLVVKRLSR